MRFWGGGVITLSPFLKIWRYEAIATHNRPFSHLKIPLGIIENRLSAIDSGLLHLSNEARKTPKLIPH
jgi:hypothetical protein